MALIGCISTRALYHITIYRLYRYFEYDTYHIIHFSYDTSNDTFLLKFRIFWSLIFPNFYETCGYIKFFGLKPDKIYH